LAVLNNVSLYERKNKWDPREARSYKLASDLHNALTRSTRSGLTLEHMRFTREDWAAIGDYKSRVATVLAPTGSDGSPLHAEGFDI
jgi:hypothetical protein